MIGAGLMGAGIAYVQAKAGIETILLDVSQEAAEKGKAYSQRIVEKDISRGKTTKEKGDALLALITPSTDYSLFNGADIVVEAVFENPEIKAEVTKKVEAHLGANAVMGTNTSTLPITGLAKASVRPGQLHRHPLLLAGRAHGSGGDHHAARKPRRRRSPRRWITSSRSGRRRSP